MEMRPKRVIMKRASSKPPAAMAARALAAFMVASGVTLAINGGEVSTTSEWVAFLSFGLAAAAVVSLIVYAFSSLSVRHCRT